MVFKTTRRVEFNHTDMAGMMHFAKFFHFMEEAECEFLRSRGLTVVMTHEGKRLSWPRVAAKCDFIKPLFFEDVVDIQVTLARVGNKSLTYSMEFSRKGEVVARGEITSCCCLVSANGGLSPIELPADVRKSLETFVVPASAAPAA